MSLRPAVQRSIAAAIAAIAVPAACSSPRGARPVAAPAPGGTRTPVFGPAPPSMPAAPRPPAPRTITLGHSALGRPITATELGDPGAGRRLVVVGCIHGNEPGGIAIARRIESLTPPPGTGVWVIEDLNPDGVASGTRQNGRGVDLNRNFPFAWASLGPPGSQQYAGPSALSEPESRLAHDLLLRLRPTVTIWYHQPLGLVDLSGGDAAVEQRYAAMVGLPTRQLTRYPGSAPTWENHELAGSTAFVVELPPGPLSEAGAGRHAAAALELIRPG